MKLLLFIVSILLVVFSSSVATASSWQGVMPWLCTERCNQTKQQVEENIQSILDHQHILSRVCFERYNLGPNATLVINNDLTNPNPIFKAKAPQLTTIAMISSYPYPPDFLDWMRVVFKNPLAFLQKVDQQLDRDNINGVNIDWEPTVTASSQDAKDYAQFLGIAAAFFTSRNKIFSVDLATWSHLWNFTEISSSLASAMKKYSTHPDLTPMMCDMSTYTWENKIWFEQLDIAVKQIVDPDLLVVGLEVFPQTDVALRFNTLKERGLCKAAIWKIPVNATWWEAVGDYVANCKPKYS